MTIIFILYLYSVPTQYKETAVPVQGCTVAERSISFCKITIIDLFQLTLYFKLPHSVQTPQPKANTGNTDRGCLWKLSQSVSRDLHNSSCNNNVSTTSSATSFKSSVTLTTPKERKRSWWNWLNLHLYVVDDKSILNHELNTHPSAMWCFMQAGCSLQWLVTGSAMPPQCSHLLMDAVISLGSFTISQPHLDSWLYYSSTADCSHPMFTDTECFINVLSNKWMKEAEKLLWINSGSFYKPNIWGQRE